MKTILLILFVLIGINLKAYSQTSSIKIIDLTVNNITYADTSGVIVDNIGLSINFKISELTAANKVEILIGTLENLGDVKTIEALFSQIGNDYFLNLNGNQYKIIEGMANVNVELSQTELNTYNNITVFVEDNQTNTTTKLYFNKQ
jgi:hypothetical protein